MTVKRLPAEPSSQMIRSREFTGFTMIETLYGPGLSMPRHAHELAHLSVVLAGSYTESSGARARLAAPALLVLHPPAETHAVQFHRQGARILGIELKARWLEHVRAGASVLERPAEVRGGVPAWLALRLYGELRAPDEVSPLATEGLLLELLAESDRGVRRQRGHTPPRWLARARELLRARATESLRLAEVAAAVGVHPVSLARAFRRFYRCTAGEYVRRVRVADACRRLAATDAPLGQIAVAIGFYDQSHFTNTFKRLTRMTPAEFRALARRR